MYVIYCDDEIIYHPLQEDATILDGQLKLALNTAGTLTFTIPRNNSVYGRIQLMKSIITLYDDERLVFRGRMYAPSTDLYQKQEIECEGELAFLNDSYQEPFELSTADVRVFLQKILDHHNRQVETSKQFLLGEVSVRNTTKSGEITRGSSEYISTLQLIKEKLLEPLGGYIWLRRLGDKTYLDYVENLNYLSQQSIMQSFNLIDAKQEINTNDFATVVIPLGGKLKNENGEESSARLTLLASTVKISIQDDEAVKKYGVISKVVKHDDITTPEHLLEAGKKDLANALGITSAYTLTAADVSKAGYKTSPFQLGTKVYVNVGSLGLEKRMLVNEINIDLLKPESNTLTIGTSEKSLTYQQFKTSSSIEKVANNLKEEMKEIQNQTIVKAVREASSHLNQTANELKLEVAEKYYNKEKADELLQSIQTLISQTAESITFHFDTLKKEQENVHDEHAEKFKEMHKYIRFENGDIILGEEGNPFTLRIENDKIRFSENGVGIASWHNKKFYAVNGEFQTSLKLGKFAFIPRNTGNLSFTKVVD